MESAMSRECGSWRGTQQGLRIGVKTQHARIRISMSKYVFDSLSVAGFSNEKYQKVNLYESHRLFCDVYCLLPGQSQRPHVHNDEDKIYHALTGTCDVQIGNETAPLPPGHTAVAPAGIEHAITNNSTAPATVLTVMAPHPRLRKAGGTPP